MEGIMFQHMDFGQYFPPDANQSQAVTALKGCQDQEIQAWLAFSKKGGFQLQPGNWNLPRQMVEAYLTLQDCEDEQVLDWVHKAQSAGNNDNPSKKTGPYWCTSCLSDKPNGYKHKDDWRREEKEHEATYVCMHENFLEATEQGLVCGLCGAVNPEDGHFEHHDIHGCVAADGTRFSCKRRRDMVNHLHKVHGVEKKSQGEAVAAKWKVCTRKQAWSCGFCVATFLSFQDRLRHLQTHFEQGKTLDDWDITMVIQGLLIQPGIEAAWKERVSLSLPSFGTSALVWTSIDLEKLQDLQYMLEVGPSKDGDSVAALVDAAYWALL